MGKARPWFSEAFLGSPEIPAWPKDAESLKLSQAVHSEACKAHPLCGDSVEEPRDPTLCAAWLGGRSSARAFLGVASGDGRFFESNQNHIFQKIGQTVRT